jgi:hypothetical protein
LFVQTDKDAIVAKEIRKRGRVETLKLKRSIEFNSCRISQAVIEIDHINFGLDKKTGNLKKNKRTSFTVKDIEKFIMLLDQEDIMPRSYKGLRTQFEIRIDCPIRGEFYNKEFIMIFDLDQSKPDLIHTITIYPAW